MSGPRALLLRCTFMPRFNIQMALMMLHFGLEKA